MDAKIVRRKMRAMNVRVGKGQRHVFDKRAFDGYVKKFTPTKS